MITTKRIYYRCKGMDDEDSIFLDYNHASNTFAVRVTSSYKKTGKLAWSSDETTYSTGEFTKKFPEHEALLNDKITEMTKEVQGGNK